jgi:hypothetical protein
MCLAVSLAQVFQSFTIKWIGEKSAGLGQTQTIPTIPEPN